MRITCTQCGATIPAEDVNLDGRLAKCRSCNNVFDFSEQIKRSGGAASSPGNAKQTAIQPARPNVPLPSGIRVVEDTTTTIESGDYRKAGGSDFRLLKSLPSSDQALYLEQRIGTCLGIEDARVGGEYTP